jgi:hypothetical protein
MDEQLCRLYTAVAHDTGQQELAGRINPGPDPTYRTAALGILILLFLIVFA